MVFEDIAERLHEGVGTAFRRVGTVRRHILDQKRGGQRLHGLPAIERVGIVGCEKCKIAIAQIGGELDRRREAAIKRNHRALVDAEEYKTLLRLGERQDAALKLAAVSKRNRAIFAVGTQEA